MTRGDVTASTVAAAGTTVVTPVMAVLVDGAAVDEVDGLMDGVDGTG